MVPHLTPNSCVSCHEVFAATLVQVCSHFLRPSSFFCSSLRLPWWPTRPSLWWPARPGLAHLTTWLRRPRGWPGLLMFATPTPCLLPGGRWGTGIRHPSTMRFSCPSGNGRGRRGRGRRRGRHALSVSSVTSDSSVKRLASLSECGRELQR